MDTQTITLVTLIIYLIYNVIITQIQQNRIKQLKNTLDEQSKYVTLIKDFNSLINVDEFKKHVDLRINNIEMEHEKEWEKSLKTTQRVIGNLHKLYEVFITINAEAIEMKLNPDKKTFDKEKLDKIQKTLNEIKK